MGNAISWQKYNKCSRCFLLLMRSLFQSDFGQNVKLDTCIQDKKYVIYLQVLQVSSLFLIVKHLTRELKTVRKSSFCANAHAKRSFIKELLKTTIEKQLIECKACEVLKGETRNYSCRFCHLTFLAILSILESFLSIISIFSS